MQDAALVLEQEEVVVLALLELVMVLVLVLEQEVVVVLALLELVMVWVKVEQSVEEMVVELEAVLLLEPQV